MVCFVVRCCVCDLLCDVVCFGGFVVVCVCVCFVHAHVFVRFVCEVFCAAVCRDLFVVFVCMILMCWGFP